MQAINAEWYKVPSGGQVTFTLSEEWAVLKGSPPSSFVQGDATLTLQYLDGSSEQIVFFDSAELGPLLGQASYSGVSSGTG
jgi:hypothetical protein